MKKYCVQSNALCYDVKTKIWWQLFKICCEVTHKQMKRVTSMTAVIKVDAYCKLDCGIDFASWLSFPWFLSLTKNRAKSRMNMARDTTWTYFGLHGGISFFKWVSKKYDGCLLLVFGPHKTDSVLLIRWSSCFSRRYTDKKLWLSSGLFYTDKLVCYHSYQPRQWDSFVE